MSEMVPLITTTRSDALVMTAALSAVGILSTLRGDDSVYPLGPVTVWVELSRADDAQQVLADIEAHRGDDLVERAPASLWMVVGVMVFVAFFTLARTVT